MSYVEVDVWTRDMETDEIARIISGTYKIEANHKLEIWVNDQLKYEEEAEGQ